MKSRKILGVTDGLVGIASYIVAFIALSPKPEEMLAVRDGQWDGKFIFVGIIMLILSASLIIGGRALFGDGGHKRSRNAFTIALATLPVQKLLLFGLRWYIVCLSDLSGRIAEIFTRNTGVLEVILIVLTLAIGIFAAVTKRASEYGDNTPDKEQSRVKSSLLEMLGANGYDICDVILTSYDGVKTAILVFGSEEAWNQAVEKGLDREIADACKAVEPDYDYRFEAKR